jgi:aspartate/methionine/tyrosine aminotransferase
VPNPGYPTYTSLSRILGARIVNYNLRSDNAWQPDFDELERMDLTGVKLMWTNIPTCPPEAMPRWRRTGGWSTSPDGTTSWW